MWRKENPPTLLVGIQPLWETVWRSFLKKLKTKQNKQTNKKNLKTEKSYYLAIPFIYISRKKYNLKRYCTPMFTTRLFLIVKTWKKPKYLLTDEWIKKMCTLTHWNINQPLKGMK